MAFLWPFLNIVYITGNTSIDFLKHWQCQVLVLVDILLPSIENFHTSSNPYLCWWTCCSVFNLCEESCFLPCIKHLKLDYRGKQKIFGSCFSIKLSIHYEHFLMAWIDAVTRLLSELYEPQELQDSGELVTVTAVTLASVVKHAVRLSPSPLTLSSVTTNMAVCDARCHVG